MECVNRYEHYIVVFVYEFHHLVYPSLVILHSHESAEYPHSIVYMDYVIPYRE